MSRRYIDADNLKIVLICTEKELTIEDIVNYIDNNICNDAIPLDRVEQIRAEISKMQTYVCCHGDAKKVELSDVLELIDKAIKEVGE